MNQYNQIPRVFVILRTSNYREPQFQLLSSAYNQYDDYYTIQNVEQARARGIGSLRISPLPNRQYQNERVYTIRVCNPETHAILEVKYWHLPFELRGYAPLLGFQYCSWIPRPTYDLPIHSDIRMDEIIRVAERIEERQLEKIQRDEESPRYRPPFHMPDFQGPDDMDDRYSLQDTLIGPTRYRNRRLPPTPPPQPEIRVVEVEVPVERVVVHVKTQPLPKPVGDILLANARGGTDTCPIAALSFGECSKLSVTSCFHIFDFESLAKWQETHATCPVCRAKIENVVSE